jgi:hypothetical protein
MTDLDDTPELSMADSGKVFCRDSIDRAMLDAAVCAAHGRSCADLDRVPLQGRYPDMPDPQRRSMLASAAWAEALPVDEAARIDANVVAGWIVERYPPTIYPAVVLGSAHGGAVHLAAALGAPWLPTSFTVTVRWPDGAVNDWDGARHAGADVAARILAANPDVTVRQIHDPVQGGAVCGSTLTLHVRWQRLPPAYRSFLRHRLAPGGASLLLRDVRTWPVLDGATGHSFQVGSPVTGWQPADYTMDNPSFARLIRCAGGGAWRTPHPALPRRYAEPAGEPALEPDLRHVAAAAHQPTHRVLYPGPETLSGCVADLYREWLSNDRRSAERCVVETERLLDPWRVLTSGVVPYWCESASRAAVTAAQWWLAGSTTFDSVDVLPAPPGSPSDGFAGLRQWRAVASFAGRHGRVSPEPARRYPLFPVPNSHAATVPPTPPGCPPAPSPMRMEHVLTGLRRTGQASGLLVL